jgi:hypothetical protein
MSPAQWTVVGLLIAGGFAGNYWYEQRDLNARADVLRQFFGLPNTMKLAEVQSLRSSTATPRIAATLRLSKPAFEQFTMQLDRADAWHPGAATYGGVPISMPEPGAIKWRAEPVPHRVGKRAVNWSTLSASAINHSQRARSLCVALQRTLRGERRQAQPPSLLYTARDCHNLQENERVDAVVLGSLDMETRTLHMFLN